MAFKCELSAYCGIFLFIHLVFGTALLNIFANTKTYKFLCVKINAKGFWYSPGTLLLHFNSVTSFKTFSKFYTIEVLYLSCGQLFLYFISERVWFMIWKPTKLCGRYNRISILLLNLLLLQQNLYKRRDFLTFVFAHSFWDLQYLQTCKVLWFGCDICEASEVWKTFCKKSH